MGKITKLKGTLKTIEVDKLLSGLEKKGFKEGVHYKCITTGGGDMRNISILIRAFCSKIFLEHINEEDFKTITEKLEII